MEFKNTLEIVTKDIQDIEKLVSNFKNYSSIPNIELDLALSRLRNVYDLLLMFREDSHTGIPEPAHKTTKEELSPEPEVDNLPVSEDDAVISDEPFEIDTHDTDNNVVTTVTSTEPDATPDIGNDEKLIGITDAPLKPGIKKKHEDKKIFIHEKLGAQSSKKDITSKLQNRAITSISGSLGINDKFLFIRELFSGNAETFRQTMEELDDARNFNDAYSLLITKFHWDMDSEPVQMLLNLVRRKFIPSGNE